MKDFPVIKFILLFIGGIILNRIINIQTNILLALIFSFLLIFLLLLKKDESEFYLLKLILISCSVILASALTLSVNKINYTDFDDKLEREKNVSVIGEIKKIDLLRSYEINLNLKCDSIKFGNKYQPVDCEFYLRIRDEKSSLDSLFELLKPGYNISTAGTFSEGRSQRNPGEFNFKNYLHSIGISGILTTYKAEDVKILDNRINYFNNIIHQIRVYLGNQIESLHLPLSSGFIKGLLLSDRSEIDYDSKIQFINTGVIHVLSVSGLHVAYVAMIFIICFGRLSLYLRSILTILGLILFMFITNSPVPVVRSVVMASVIITTFLLNRTTNVINSLAISALAILLISPDELFSPSFQLSFAAVFGMAAITPPITDYIHSLKLKSTAIKYLLLFFAVSFGAQAGTLPLTLYYFGKLSIISFIANLFIVPVTGMIIAIAFFTLIINPISHWLAYVYAFVNDYLTVVTFAFIKSAGEFSFSFARIHHFSILNAVTSTLLLAAGMILWRKFNSRTAKLGLIIFLILNIYVYSRIDDNDLMPANVLSVMMIDVGQGDSFLIKFPDGKTALIDAGNADIYFDNGERVLLPLLEHLDIESIDYGFVSHIDSDHYAGFIAILDKNKVKMIFKPELDSTLDKDVRFEKYLHKKGVQISYYKKGFMEIGGTRFYILNEPTDKTYTALSTNDKSGIFKLVYGNTSFLFTGDLEKDGENYFTNKYSNFLQSDVLKVGHHGSKTSTSNEFYRKVNPKISLVSAGFKNKFGHPAFEVLERLQNNVSNIIRTDLSGASILQSDGDSIKIVKWK